MWRERDPDHPDVIGEWRGEVEHIQSGQRWLFDTLEDLVQLLADPEAAVEGESPPGSAEG